MPHSKHLPDKKEEFVNAKNSPLAARMRPRTLDEFTGQDHIIGPGRLLRRAIQADQLSSVIFYGPPGTGKTTLAQIIANTTKAEFIAINAVLSGVKDIRESIEQAKINRQELNKKTILFIDEVHRFNKAQQDALLPHVESGMIILIGATTENPYFEVNKALVSRSRIFQLRPLNDDDIREVLLATLKEPERGYGNLKVNIETEALEHLVRIAGGDARSALNALELAIETTPPDQENVINIGLGEAEESIQKRAVLYDKDGDAHYDTISAFIKSIRGSDPDASLYWMAKMLYAGEDPRFIFRRMIILASEDVGLADPNALRIVMSAAQAYDYVGLPEGQFHLSHACLYLATAPKSNSTMAFFDAIEAVNRERDSDVPDHLKDGNRDKNDFGHGKGYNYPHAYRDHWVAQQYLPTSLQGKMFYEPSDMGYEKEVKERVILNRELQLASAQEGWQDNFLGAKATGLKNRWLERALSQTSEILRKVREQVFALALVNRESLVLDLSGGTGLLTWEACRRCFAGGVWTRCDDASQVAAMQEWSKHMEVLNRPELFVSSIESLEKFFSSLKEKPHFDVIAGLDIIGRLSGKAEDTEHFLNTLKYALAAEGRVILAEKDPQNSQYLSEIITAYRLGEKLHKQLFSLEKELRNRKKSELAQISEKAEKAGFSKSKLVQEDIIVKRHFSAIQVQKWFDMSSDKISDSIFSIVKTELSEKDYNHFKAVTLDVLANHDLNWKQSYEFLWLGN
jgi:putative ATPase